jgi:hypothetical protein
MFMVDAPVVVLTGALYGRPICRATRLRQTAKKAEWAAAVAPRAGKQSVAL